MCQILKVNRSSYYDWLRNCNSTKQQEDQTLTKKIKEIFMNNYGNYGTRRIKRTLAKDGLIVSRRRIARLMKEAKLVCKTRKRFKATTYSNHKLPVFPNLLNRNFSPARIDQCYAGDITYIHTDEGWLYLAVVMDLYSRRVVGWAMSKTMKASLVNDALLMAIWKRKPKQGLIWHTDRGSQYAADSHRTICKAHGIIQSMSGKGECWDNAVSESFFHTLKVELVYSIKFNTRQEAKNEIFKYIEIYYNRLRMHSTNDYMSPVEYELRSKSA